MSFTKLRFGLGAGIVSLVASVAGEVYRDEGIVGQRVVGWIILLLALVGIVSGVAYVLELQNRIDRYESALRQANLNKDPEKRPEKSH